MPTKRFVIPVLLVSVALAGGFVSYLLFGGVEPVDQLSYENTATKTEENAETARASAALLESEYLGLEPDATLDDITVSLNDDDKALKAYGIELALIMGQFSGATKESEPGIMFQALENKDKNKTLSEIEKLKKLAEVYRRTGLNLSALIVPEEIAPTHILITNSVTRLEVHVRNMGGILEDPVKAITSADGYVKESRNLFSALKQVNEFFVAHNITFDEGEQAQVSLHEI